MLSLPITLVLPLCRSPQASPALNSIFFPLLLLSCLPSRLWLLHASGKRRVPETSVGFPSAESFRNRLVVGSWDWEWAVWFFLEHPFISFSNRLLGLGTPSEEKLVPGTRAVTQDLLWGRLSTFHRARP